MNKYEYLADEKILRSDQSRMIEQAKFTYSLLGKKILKIKHEKLQMKEENKYILS